jgi:ferredoxin-NADP reductase
VFEIVFDRPKSFNVVAGQKIRIANQSVTRDYSLTNAPQDDHLVICVRHIPGGAVSPVLAEAKVGQRFQVSEAFGYFTYQPSDWPAVFIATGTGIAPFVAYVRSGVNRFYLLHGVRTKGDLYYRDIVEPLAGSYIGCISQLHSKNAVSDRVFAGRVTHYLQSELPAGRYDFYLCGRGEMVRDAMAIIDRRFEGGRVFTEIFF